MSVSSPRLTRHDRIVRLGFVPLVDCAPLVVAQERKFFRKYGVEVMLSRELGWATVRDKILYKELDAAHAVAGMAFAATCGWGSVAQPCLTGMILNANGNGITLSQTLFNQGVRDARTLKMYLSRHRSQDLPTFGTVSPFGSHNFLLRRWLRSGGIDPDRDVHIVIVPPPLVCQNLKAGTLDGFCVGEPWNSLAVHNRIGWTVATSVELSPDHPEKILLVRKEFAQKREDQHLALIAALLEACAWCDAKENLEELLGLLCRREYINLPPWVLHPCLSGCYDYGHGRKETREDFITFHRHGANEPTEAKISWISSNLADNGFHKIAKPSLELGRKVFRADIHHQACQLLAGEKETLSIQN